MNGLRKICLIVICSYISCSVLSQQSLRFDSSFIQNSTAWLLRCKGGKKKFPKTIYDSLQLIYAFKDSSVPILKDYNRGFHFLEEAGSIENLYLNFIYSGSDTVFVKAKVRHERERIEINQTWLEELIFGRYNKENPDSYSYISSAGFAFSGNDEVWVYRPKQSENDIWVLTNTADSIFIEQGGYKEGIVFYLRGKAVAVFETARFESIRLLNNLPGYIKKLLAVFISTTYCFPKVLKILL
jgi:hypothetical protein